jgi:hypothetical protein
MQYEVLKEGRKVVYKYKTYIAEDGRIRIKYMSDLLRVMPLTKIDVNVRNIDYRDAKEIKIHKEKIQEYTRITKEQRQDLVNMILENEEWSPEYFVFKNYQNKIMRRLDRLSSRFVPHWLRKFGYIIHTMLFTGLALFYSTGNHFIVTISECNATSVLC